MVAVNTIKTDKYEYETECMLPNGKTYIVESVEELEDGRAAATAYYEEWCGWLKNEDGTFGRYDKFYASGKDRMLIAKLTRTTGETMGDKMACKRWRRMMMID